ncbi:unnamed protein product [Linum trigynum]|uniref:SHSP domain-containing protein n=1 Tax=Linum trigynum TaxID=586398 RepID=A0AAV2FEK8_9ROSI
MFLNSTFSLQNCNLLAISVRTHRQISQSRIGRATLLVFLLVIAAAAAGDGNNCSDPRGPGEQNPEGGASIMKVHPMPNRRNNITIRYYVNHGGSGGNNQRGGGGVGGELASAAGGNKRLRRLPHIFNRVLELPFRSDAEVLVEESTDCFRFVAEADDVGEVRAHTIEIHPGVTKIVIRPNGYLELPTLDDLELDMWRFRLPESTRPDLASAVFTDGELIVTVPKAEEEGNNNGSRDFRGGMGNNNNNARLVLVQ